MLEVGLVDLLKNSDEFTATFGPRVYPVLLPDASQVIEGQPNLTYQVITDMALSTLEGNVRFECRIQFDVWAARYLEALTAEQSIIDVLHGFTGTLSELTFISSCELDMRRSTFEPSARIYRRSNEFVIAYQVQQ